jgi:hypothetical protein
MMSANVKAGSRVKLAKAVDVLNDVLTDTCEVSQQRVQVALFVVNKMLPSMQAVAVQVEHKIASNISDLEARALEHGIDPSLLLPEKKVIEQEPVEDPPTPESDA